MKKIAFLGSSNAMKPQIILDTLLHMDVLVDTKLLYFTDNEEGLCSDYCKENNIELVVFPNNKLNDTKSRYLAMKQEVDLLVSAGWPHKVPAHFLKLFKYTPINCHGSILPDYRGKRAYMHYWANCEEYYGATIHYMNEKFDDGKIIVQGRLKLYKEETPEILHRRTAELCAYLLPTAINLVKSGFKGTKGVGLKRYFYQLSHAEFEEYRRFNESNEGYKRKITPHRIIE